MGSQKLVQAYLMIIKVNDEEIWPVLQKGEKCLAKESPKESQR